MSKKVKNANSAVEVTTNQVTEIQLETTSIAPTESLSDPVSTEPKLEAKKEKVTKTTKKATEKKTTKTVKAPVVNTFVQFAGNEYATDAIMEKIKESWVNAGNKLSTIKTMNLYVKPEEYAAYYVINDHESGKVYL